MKHKFNFKLLLSAGAIAIFTAGCQSSGLNNSRENPTNYSQTPANTTVQASDNLSGLNLTNNQKAQIKDIREQNQDRILALLSSEQQEKYRAATQNNNQSSTRVLRSLNLTTEQRQQIREIQRTQRQQIQAILTPEQQAKIRQQRGSKERDRSQSY